jgi:hypothetical protein
MLLAPEDFRQTASILLIVFQAINSCGFEAAALPN